MTYMMPFRINCSRTSFLTILFKEKEDKNEVSYRYKFFDRKVFNAI